MKINISISSKSDLKTNIEKALIWLDRWFYSYPTRENRPMPEGCEFPNKYRVASKILHRAIVLPGLHVNPDEVKPIYTYDSWAPEDEDVSGYLGFIKVSPPWIAFLFEAEVLQKDIVVNLELLAKDKAAGKVIAELQKTDTIGENINTLWSGDDGGPLREVIVRSNPRYYKKLIGYKTSETHKAPYSGNWLPPKPI